jgi:hypothetical protein
MIQLFPIYGSAIDGTVPTVAQLSLVWMNFSKNEPIATNLDQLFQSGSTIRSTDRSTVPSMDTTVPSWTQSSYY